MDRIVYNFIVSDSSGYSLADMENGSLEDFWQIYCHGEYAWALQTYHILKQYGMSLKLSSDLDPDAVNLAHVYLLPSLPKRSDCYCVSMQTDFPHFPLAQYHIVQNQAQVCARNSWLPHWPQIKQVGRDPHRTAVKKVAYQGALNYTDLDAMRINADLEKQGLSFEILDSSNWWNLGDVDVLVGIRNFGRRKYKRKPPSKLINAWHAGIPFIGGWDSAYSQIGAPGEDYLRVSSYEEMLREIIELKNNPVLYQWMVHAGRKRAREYTVDSIAQQWKGLLENEIASDYQRWKGMSAKSLRYGSKLLGYLPSSGMRSGLRQFYRIPIIKRFRDLYYDPVR